MKKHSYTLDWVTDNLAVGQAPMTYEALASIKEQGIGAILNLCAEFCDLHWIEADAGFEVYYFPIPDEEAPDLAELEKALDWLDECLFLGKRVLIHCRHGIGRTGTVVNAYLLRKGLGHKLAGKKLKGLKSKPVNFDQWWFIRKYGKKEKPLTIREPSLENRQLVDLFPYFADVEALWADVEVHLGADGAASRCGRGHSRCCREAVLVSFVESVYINHIISTHLGRRERQECVARAVAFLRSLKELAPRGSGEPEAGWLAAYRGLDLLCPLNFYEECLIFAQRPLACRVFDLPGPADQLVERWREGLTTLSQQVFFAFTSHLAENGAPRFLLPEVVSGKFVQAFFQQMSVGPTRMTTSGAQGAEG